MMNNQISKWMIILGTVGGTLAFGPAAAAWAAPSVQTTETNGPSGQTRSQLISATAKVESIDHGARTVTLKGDEDREMTISVPPDVKAFDKLKVGDKVDIDYYESMAVSMLPTGTKPSATERKGRAVDVGGGVMGREVTISAEVVSVDASANTVTFKGPHGHLRTVTVSDPTLQQKLPMLKPGQVVQVEYTQATAAAIRPSSK
jgi:Cu/Ag efflux protein CusF